MFHLASLTAALQSTTGAAAAWLALGLVGLGVLGWGRSRVKGTTLDAPASWALFSLAMIVSSELLLLLTAAEQTAWAETLRFAVAMTTFCPMMAVLGAKRPQDRGWQFIVLSLWLLLMVPSGQAVLFQPGEPLVLFPAWSWFLLVLIFMGLANYLPTRFWLSCLLAVGGQTLLVLHHLPLGLDFEGRLIRLAAVGAIVLAAVLAALGIPGRRRGQGPLDQVWIDFRDWFGAVWGLRVAERLRANAAMYGWELTPSWHGFVQHEASAPLEGDVEEALERSLRTLLRRFVSPQWIAARLQKP